MRTMAKTPAAFRCSLNRNTDRQVAATIPMPDQEAYAMLSSMPLRDLDRKKKQMT